VERRARNRTPLLDGAARRETDETLQAAATAGAADAGCSVKVNRARAGGGGWAQLRLDSGGRRSGSSSVSREGAATRQAASEPTQTASEASKGRASAAAARESGWWAPEFSCS
jgi:hypothetical protein